MKGRWMAVGAVLLLAGPGARALDARDPAPDTPSARRLERPGVPLSKVVRTGMATISRDRLEGHTTANGEQYNRNALTAAHRTLPLGALVRVTNVRNQRNVVVRINDRGPGIGSAIIELTPRAAALIGLHGISTGEVRIDPLGAVRLPAEVPAPEPATPAPPVK